MTTTVNGGRPLPWHDTAQCAEKDCGGPMVPVALMANGYGGAAGSLPCMDAGLPCYHCEQDGMSEVVEFLSVMDCIMGPDVEETP